MATLVEFGNSRQKRRLSAKNCRRIRRL